MVSNMPDHRGQSRRLAAFVKTLDDRIGLEFTSGSFEKRLKLQKLVYLAKYFGLDLGYDYNLYLHGPYSPSLADDYYSLPDAAEVDLTELREDDFFDLVGDMDAGDLELVATIAHFYDAWRDRIDDGEKLDESVIEKTIMLKDTTREEARELLDNLKRRRVL